MLYPSSDLSHHLTFLGHAFFLSIDETLTEALVFQIAAWKDPPAT